MVSSYTIKIKIRQKLQQLPEATITTQTQWTHHLISQAACTIIITITKLSLRGSHLKSKSPSIGTTTRPVAIAPTLQAMVC